MEQNKRSYTETFWESKLTKKKSRIHSITAKAALKFGSEVWVLKKREEQRLEAAQMKFLRHLFGITKLDKEKNQCIRQKTGAPEHSKGNKTVPGEVATTRTEDGHKQNTKTSTTVSTKRTNKHRTTEEEMEGPTSSAGLGNRKHA